MKKSRTTTRAIKILEAIASEAKGISLSEISAAVDIPITSASDIIRALVEEEFVEVIDERSKLYGIGVKAFFIGNAFIANTSIIDKSKAIIEELSKVTERTVFLGREVSGRITYIYKYEPKNPLVATCDIGSRTNLHCTSLGKSFLAHTPEMFEGLRSKELVKKTPFTITDIGLLEEELEEVRKKGYALDRREQNDHLLCVGGPIFDSSNKVIAALSVSGLYREDTDIEYLGLKVREAAGSISKKMGYTEAANLSVV